MMIVKKNTTYILVLILILITLYGVSTFYLDKNKIREDFKGQPPSEYINLLPSDPADIGKISGGRNFNPEQVKPYFPNTLVMPKRPANFQPGMVLKPVVDGTRMVPITWKIVDEFNARLSLIDESLDQMNKILVSSNEMLDLLREKCK